MKTKHAIKLAKPTFFALTLMVTSCTQSEKASYAAVDVTTPQNDSKITPDDYTTDPHLDKDVREFLKALNSNGKPLESLSPTDAKKALFDGQAAVKVDLSGVEVDSKTINTDGKSIKLKIVRPNGNKERLPVFVFIHGGGWVLGDYPTHERMVRDLVVRTGYACVFIDYTRTPEAQYPVAINEIYAATKWISEHGGEVNVDGKNLALVGNSVGANMAVVTALKAKEKNGPEIEGLVLL